MYHKYDPSTNYQVIPGLSAVIHITTITRTLYHDAYVWGEPIWNCWS